MSFTALLLLCSAVSFAGEFEDGLAAAANKGDAEAQYMVGLLYATGQGVSQDYKQAVAWYRKAADQGYASAQFNLGQRYYEGQGVTQDYSQAASWYRKAADQGNAGAQYNLAVMYDNGTGVTQDYKQAMVLYRKAADQGLVRAQNNLGLLYLKGNGVTQDYVEAHKWLNIAAAYSTEKEVRDTATENRDLAAKSMTPAQIAEAQKRASEWKKK